MFSLSILVSVFLFGCVSTQEYNDLETRNKKTEQEIAGLKRENEQVKQNISDLETQITALKKESDELRARNRRIEIILIDRDLDLAKKIRDKLR